MATLVDRPVRLSTFLDAIREHWPEYLMEGAGLALFMISACTFALLLEHPSSQIHALIPEATTRRMLMGLAMGATAIAIIYSPWGKQSGAHINPSVTLSFLRLGRVMPADATFYIVAQFFGGSLGVALAGVVFGRFAADPAVNYVATLPGRQGDFAAWFAELAISFLLMSILLRISANKRWGRYTGVVAGLMVAIYISIEAPISGMSMNPARSFSSALAAGAWHSLWIYFTAPPIGMLLAAELFRRMGRADDGCAKLHHENATRCIFCGKEGGEIAHKKRPVLRAFL